MSGNNNYKIIVEKEYKKLPENFPTIGMVMMVKNEHKRLHVSLESVAGHVDALIMYDTGSTDDTLEIIQNFAEKYTVNLYLIQGTFVDFFTSRNVVLEYAEKVPVHYLLLMDCNDELQGGKSLRQLAVNMFTKENNAFLLCQKWWSGHYDRYFNIRFVKNRCGWRYRGVVHEWLKDTTIEGPETRYPVIKIENDITLYQDRTQDDDKSGKRFVRDKELLLTEYKRDPTNARTVFYLAQTCQCLGQYDEAYYYSKIRSEMEGFEEERFHSFLRCGNCAIHMKHDWYDVLKWYLKAYEHTPRAEPLVSIADYYRSAKKWRQSYFFIKEACSLEYPECILFVDSGVYEYYRWHLMGIVGFYSGNYEDGKDGALKAIKAGRNVAHDKSNLQFYLDKEKEIQKEKTKIEREKLKNERERLTMIKAELKKQFPKITQKQLELKAQQILKNMK
jgi:glycosyltransferase involved in cell wall biosynthesis